MPMKVNLKKFTKLLVLTFCLLYHAGVRCDQNFDSFFSNQINTFNSLIPQEKVYLHFDNTSYYLGDTIWFKAYLVNPERNMYSKLSRVLYVELLNQQGYVLDTKKYKISDGQCHGDLALNDSFFAGFYEVRAYTRYMLNFTFQQMYSNHQDSKKNLAVTTPKKVTENYSYLRLYNLNKNYFHTIRWANANQYTRMKKSDPPNGDAIFSRVIPIYDPPSTEGGYYEKTMSQRPFGATSNPNGAQFAEKQLLQVGMAFYPEGGCLVRGFSNKVGFKITGSNGEDLNVEGSVLNSLGKKVAEFKTEYQGMGAFSFVPNNEKYVATFTSDGKEYTFRLPESLKEGCVMNVDNLSENQSIRIRINSFLTPKILGLNILCRGKVYWCDTLRLGTEGQWILSIPDSILPTGVSQITLFNKEGKIQAERLIFINHREYEQIQLKTGSLRTNYRPFEDIQMNLSMFDKKNKPVETSFSLAIRDAETLEPTFNSSGIVSNLLLSSDLKGFIRDPAFYFESDDYSHRKALDLLMLVQGWRRYSWVQMAGVELFGLSQPIEKGLLMDGYVNTTNKETFVFEPLPNDSIWFRFRTDSMLYTGEQATGKNGSFSVVLPDIYGSWNATIKMYHPIIKKKRTIWRTFNDPYGVMAMINRFSPIPKPAYSYYEKNVPTENYAQDTVSFLNSEDHILKETEVTSKRKLFSYKKPVFNRPDIVLTSDQIEELVMDRYCPSGDLFYPALESLISSVYGLSLFRSDLYFENENGEIRSIFANGEFLRLMEISDIRKCSIFIDPAPRVPMRYFHSDGVGSSISAVTFSPNGLRPQCTVLVSWSLGWQKREPYTRKTRIQGFSYVSDFYHPDYSNADLPTLKDYRRTLYWNPDVRTDSEGKATIRFFNNSTCNTLDVSAEGLTSSGIPFEFQSKR
jgi:hypothetical protein